MKTEKEIKQMIKKYEKMAKDYYELAKKYEDKPNGWWTGLANLAERSVDILKDVLD